MSIQYKNKFKNICRDSMSTNGCTHNPCKFIHDPDLCINFYSKGKCDGLCNKNHFINQDLILNKLNDNNNSKKIYKKKPINTETFKPNYSPPDMKIQFEYGKLKSEIKSNSNDVIIVPDLFVGENDIYNRLLQEVFATNFNKQELIIPWHEGCHLIVDDHLDWKKSCPTFQMIIDKVAKYFSMDIKATRFNWYQNKDDWKAFHHDAAAIDPKKSLLQNFTVGISFGATRDIAFQVANHKDCRNVVALPMHDGTIFCFGKDVNIDWRHGILPVKTEQNYQSKSSDGRISIIAWGWVKQNDLKPNNHI